MIEAEVAAPNLGRFVIAGSLGLESASHLAVPIEGLLLRLLGHCQAVPIDLVEIGFVVVAAGSGLALGLPWVGPWTSLWMRGVSPLARESGLELAAWDRPVTLSSSASHMAATELDYGFVS